MSYVKRRKVSVFTELKNLPKLRSRAREGVRRKVYGTLLVFGVTYAVVFSINLVIGRSGF